MYTLLGFALHSSSLTGFFNSKHVVLKSSICTLASPGQQLTDWGLRVTQNAYFSLMTHTKHLLLVMFCYTTAGIRASNRTHAWMDARTHAQTEEGQTDVEVEIVI